jgi:hypothetical protein
LEEVSWNTSSPFWEISEAENGTRVRTEGVDAIKERNLVYSNSTASILCCCGGEEKNYE